MQEKGQSIHFRDLVACLRKAWKGMLRICLQDHTESLHGEQGPNQISALGRLSWQQCAGPILAAVCRPDWQEVLSREILTQLSGLGRHRKD